MLSVAVLSRKYRPAIGSSPSQRAAKDAKEMAAGKHQHVAFDRAHALDDAIGRGADVVRRFAAGAPIAKELPVGPLAANVGRRLRLRTRHSSIPPDRRRFRPARRSRPARRCVASAAAGWRTLRANGSSPISRPVAGRWLAALGQRQIGQAGVLTADRPRGFAMSCQVNGGQIRAHACTSPGGQFDGSFEHAVGHWRRDRRINVA